ncbi:MAG: winged helix-turn-helix domain-containing protein [Pseudomonadota bacterium]
MAASARFSLGSWTVDASANELVDGDQRQRLSPKAMAVLAQLHSADGEVVTRAELCDGVGLSDEGLSRVVVELRQALGESARAPRHVETIPRRGYRLRPAAPAPAPGAWQVRAGVAVVALMLLGLFLVLRSAGPAAETAHLRLGPPVDLTSFEGAAMLPTLVDDRVRFARGPVDRAPATVWEVDLDTLNLASVDVAAGVVIALPSPDGRRTAEVRSGSGRCVLTLREQDVAGPGVPCAGGRSGIDWAPDSSAVYFAVPGGGIARLDAETGDVETLTAPPVGQYDQLPAVSPAGERLLFARGTAIISELMLLELGTGAGARPQTNDGQMVFGVDWFDDETFVFVSDRLSMREIWSGRVDRQIFRSHGGTDAMAVVANDRWIVYEQPIYDADIFMVGDRRAIVDSLRYDNHPRLSPDGRRLAFISNRTGHPAVWLADADGASPKRLFEVSVGRVSRPYWASDDVLLVVAFTPRGSEVVRVAIDGTATMLVPADFAPLEAVALPDGSVLATGRDGAGRGVFRATDTGIGRWSNLDVRRLEVGPGGLPLATIADRVGLHRIDGDRAEPVFVQDFSASDHWAASGRFLVWATHDGVWRHDFEIGRTERLAAQGSDIVGLALDVSPDGERVLVSRNVSRQIDLVARPVLSPGDPD